MVAFPVARALGGVAGGNPDARRLDANGVVSYNSSKPKPPRRRSNRSRLPRRFSRNEDLNEPLPLLTAELPGVGGRLKCEPEDFTVEEILAFVPAGEGGHLFLYVEKRGVSHEQLVRHIARQLGISRSDVGTAGMKDRHAVTRQFVSVPAECEPKLSDVDGEGVRILDVTRNPRKLKTGKLKGNRFAILLRDVAERAESHADAVAGKIRRLGFPNYFGEQRFGVEGNTLQTGLQLLKGELKPKDLPPARRRFLLRLALSAVQSQLFNVALAKRLQDGLLHTVLAGDVMQVTASGGLFNAEDLRREQPRFEAGEIAVTGPIFGPKMRPPEGDAHRREDALLQELELNADDWNRFARLCPGTRRPYLIRLDDLQVAPQEEGLRFEFTLPAGSYATVLLAEFMKSAP